MIEEKLTGGVEAGGLQMQWCVVTLCLDSRNSRKAGLVNAQWGLLVENISGLQIYSAVLRSFPWGCNIS